MLQEAPPLFVLIGLVFLLELWNNSSFCQIATSLEFYHSRRLLIGGSSFLGTFFLFPLSTAPSGQLVFHDLQGQPNANLF